MGKKVWVNGCFDILHMGHIHLLLEARKLGDVYVGIDSDSRVKQLKGNSRPIISQGERMVMLSALRMVNEVYIFESEEMLRTLIRGVAPDYFVIGEDYKERTIIGSEFAKEVVFVPILPYFSTTNIVEKIKALRK